MKFTVTLDRDEDGVWVVECPAIPGCVSQGKTKAEAMAAIEEAIQLCLEVRAENGLSHEAAEYTLRRVHQDSLDHLEAEFADYDQQFVS